MCVITTGVTHSVEFQVRMIRFSSVNAAMNQPCMHLSRTAPFSVEASDLDLESAQLRYGTLFAAVATNQHSASTPVFRFGFDDCSSVDLRVCGCGCVDPNV